MQTKSFVYISTQTPNPIGVVFLSHFTRTGLVNYGGLYWGLTYSIMRFLNAIRVMQFMRIFTELIVRNAYGYVACSNVTVWSCHRGISGDLGSPIHSSCALWINSNASLRAYAQYVLMCIIWPLTIGWMEELPPHYTSSASSAFGMQNKHRKLLTKNKQTG